MIFISEESDLKLKDNLTAIYFYTDWLLFHKKMMIMLEKVEITYPKINFFAVDAEDFKALSKRYFIDSVPTVIILNVNGKELKRITGMSLTKAFKAAFADIYELHGEENVKKNNEI